jgi:ribosomal-protein-alanine N-acetyltransferase
VNHAWPVTLADGELALRPLRLRDGAAWREVRQRNLEWLRPWDATLPVPDPETPMTFAAMVRQGNREARAGRLMPFGVFCAGVFVGQVTVGSISWGSLRSAYIGYWVDERYAGRGIVPRAVVLVGDYCFGTLGLHRLEINIRPENTASLSVVRKLGFRNEGLRERYLHIDGRWCDHWLFAVTAEERPFGLGSWSTGQVPGVLPRSPQQNDGRAGDTVH